MAVAVTPQSSILGFPSSSETSPKRKSTVKMMMSKMTTVNTTTGPPGTTAVDAFHKTKSSTSSSSNSNSDKMFPLLRHYFIVVLFLIAAVATVVQTSTTSTSAVVVVVAVEAKGSSSSSSSIKNKSGSRGNIINNFKKKGIGHTFLSRPRSQQQQQQQQRLSKPTTTKHIGKKNFLRSSSSSTNSRPLSLSDWYLRSCEERPFLTKGITAGCIAAVGDMIAQYLEFYYSSRSGDNDISSINNDIDSNTGPAAAVSAAATIMMFFTTILNVRRVTTFFLCGSLFTGPFVHVWYKYIAQVGKSLKMKFESSLPKEMPRFVEVWSQVLLDQTVGVVLFFPLYLMVYDMVESVVMYGQWPPSYEQALAKCHTYIYQVVTMQYRIFPYANIINFTFVPEQLRVLFSNLVSLFWNVYLCSLVS